EPEHAGRKGKAGGSVRPMAGPVVPLTGSNVGSEQGLLRRRHIRQARPTQVGDGCLCRSNGPRAEAGPAPGATSSHSRSLDVRAPERFVLRIEWLVDTIP